MTQSLSALSLSSTFTEAGALAAFGALFGIAMLALLCFSQAREIKRLREWAGRAPERAAELEQRVTAQAARGQRAAAVPARPTIPAAPAPATVAPGAATPAAAAETAAAAAAATAPAPGVQPPVSGMPRAPVPPAPQPSTTQPATSKPVPAGQPPVPVPALSGSAVGAGVALSAAAAAGAGMAAGANATPKPNAAPGQAAPNSTPQAAPANVAGAGASPATPPPDARPQPGGGSPLAISASDHRAPGGPGAERRQDAAPISGRPLAPGPAAAAATTPASATETATDPSPAPATAAAAAAASAAGAAPAGAERPRTPPPPPGPPAPRRAAAASARDVSRSSGALYAEGGIAPPRTARAREAALAGAGAGARGAQTPTGSARLRGERAPVRKTLILFAGGAVLLVLVLLLALGAFNGGGSSSKEATGAASGTAVSTSSHAKKSKPASPQHATAGAASPAETSVSVLNGTETAGLAHRVAGRLVQMGYSKASALAGRPEGSNQVTVIDYTSGHKADAAAVAQRLGVSTVQPIEGSASALAGSANVVVIVGLDKASSSP